MASMTALECYKLLLNDYVSPALRERHFMGSDSKYELPHEKAFIQVGFQKDKWTTLAHYFFMHWSGPLIKYYTISYSDIKRWSPPYWPAKYLFM